MAGRNARELQQQPDPFQRTGLRFAHVDRHVPQLAQGGDRAPLLGAQRQRAVMSAQRDHLRHIGLATVQVDRVIAGGEQYAGLALARVQATQQRLQQHGVAEAAETDDER
jgi:hypothetical protein